MRKNSKEFEILKKAYQSKEGKISPALMINSFAIQDRQSVENLVAKGYLDMFKEHVNDHDVNFYRLSEKGLVRFESIFFRAWYVFKSDLRNILISVITTLVTLYITYLLG